MQEHLSVEEELRDRTLGAGIDLALEIIEIELRVGSFGMGFGIRSDRNVEVGDSIETRHQIGGVLISARMRRVSFASLRRIAAQGHDVSNARLPVRARHVVHLLARRGDTRQMCRRRKSRFRQNPANCGMRAVTRAAARAVRDGDKARTDGCKSEDRLPQRLLHLFRLGGEKLE